MASPLNPGSTSRTAALLAAGLLVGLLVGFLAGRNGTQNSRQPRDYSDRESLAAKASWRDASALPKFSDTKAFLGDIATVPFQELYAVLSQRSPKEMVELAHQLDSLPPGRQTQTKIEAFYKVWAHLDPISAFRAATSLSDLDTRLTAIGATISGADPAAIPKLAKALKELSNEVVPLQARSNLFANVLAKWSVSDAPAAARFADSVGATDVNFTMAFNSIGRTWASDDPRAAIAWAEGKATSPFGSSALIGALEGWWEKDPAGAEAYALAHIGDAIGQQAIAAVMSAISQKDPLQAAVWAGRIPDDTARREAYSNLAARWAFTDPKAASEWAATLPPANQREMLNLTASLWSANDPKAAGQWISTLTGDAYDYAANAYSLNAVDKNPVTALSWAASIAQEKMREDALKQVVKQWMARDPAGAHAGVQNSALSDAEKARLLSAPGG